MKNEHKNILEQLLKNILKKALSTISLKINDVFFQLEV